MANEVDPPEVERLAQPQCQPRLTELPVELLFHIIRQLVGMGRECDVSALARTNKRMYFVFNAELYRLVIKYRTFYIVHWAVRENKMAALRTALAHGADPNQLCTLGYNERYNNIISPRSYRPLGWGLNTPRKVDWAIRKQITLVLRSRRPLRDPTHVNWREAWFSASDLSIVSSASLKSLCHHYRDNVLSLDVDYFREIDEKGTEFPAQAADDSMMGRRDGARFDELSSPVDDGFSFPTNMSRTFMDNRDVKIAFVRLFQRWTTPLHLAALAPHDNPEVTEALLANGANIDIAGKGVCFCDSTRLPSSRSYSPRGNRIVAYTPLHVAICFRNYSTARVLVAHGAQRMAKLFSGNNERSWFPQNALHTALSIGAVKEGFDYDFIEFLLRNGYAARIEERNHEGLTPLLLACNAFEDLARDKLVRLLLRYGAKIDSQGPLHPDITAISGPWLSPNEQATPALWAARKGQFRLCKLLLEHGADINAMSSGSLVTILHALCSRPIPGTHFSATKDRADLFDYVLVNISDKGINAFDKRGKTPLSMLNQWNILVQPRSGAESRLLGMGSRLFGKGADILAGIKEGRKTPFEYMIENALDIDNYGFCKTCKPSQFCNKVLATMQASRIDQHPDIPKAFLNRFWDIWGRAMRGIFGEDWRLTLEIASSLVHAFLNVGFSPVEVDNRGNNALASFLKYLIDHPRLVTYRNAFDNGYDSSGWGRYDGSMFALSTIAVLQDNGAAPHVKNEEGYTAFDYLYEITDYDGPDQERVALARVMKRLVQCAKDNFGNLFFKFQTPLGRFGSVDEV